MHMDVKHGYECRAVQPKGIGLYDQKMPPVPKPKHRRAPHFIAAWRRHKGMNQTQLAELLEVDQGTISRLERGESPYDQDALERLAIIFGCEIDDILTVDPQRPEDKARLVYSSLRKAPKPLQEQAVAILEALLKTA